MLIGRANIGPSKNGKEAKIEDLKELVRVTSIRLNLLLFVDRIKDCLFGDLLNILTGAGFSIAKQNLYPTSQLLT